MSAQRTKRTDVIAIKRIDTVGLLRLRYGVANEETAGERPIEPAPASDVRALKRPLPHARVPVPLASSPPPVAAVARRRSSVARFWFGLILGVVVSQAGARENRAATPPVHADAESVAPPAPAPPGAAHVAVAAQPPPIASAKAAEAVQPLIDSAGMPDRARTAPPPPPPHHHHHSAPKIADAIVEETPTTPAKPSN